MLFKFNLNEAEYNLCLEFSKNSAKTQREYRSGGTQIRVLNQIEEDTLRGKVGEVVAVKFLGQSPLNITNIKLDFNIYPRGKWDEQDFTLSGKKIAIKSAKWFSRWLLIETKDVNRGDIYDIYVLIVVSKDFKSGEVKGYATKDEILNALKLKKGENIPNTNTSLDADNNAIHSKDLHNSEQEWQELIKKCLTI